MLRVCVSFYIEIVGVIIHRIGLNLASGPMWYSFLGKSEPSGAYSGGAYKKSVCYLIITNIIVYRSALINNGIKTWPVNICRQY